jgi:hypothetical protein
MNFFIPIVLITISVGVFFTYIDSEYQDVLELKKIKRNFVAQEQQTKKIIKERKGLAERYEKIDARDEKGLSKLVPDHINNVELIVDIQRIIKENIQGIQISDISIVNLGSTNSKKNEKIKISDNKKYDSVDIKFSFTTKYNTFKRFINNVQTSLRILDVVSIAISSPEDKLAKENNNLKFDIVLRAHKLKK